MMQKHLIGKVAEGGRRFLAEKLPDNSVVFETPDGFIFRLSGAFELHSLALENKLKGREEELTEEIINATCTINGDGDNKDKEVSESPRSLSSPGHATVPRLLARVLSVLLLLSRGADPNLPAISSKYGSLTTPIWLAAGRGSLETVQELLRHGARLDSSAQRVGFFCIGSGRVGY